MDQALASVANNNPFIETQSLDFSALKIRIASPEDILKWSKGEVTKPETINYRTFRPEKDGLFDERIFGPTKDYECYCGKYKRIRYKGIICDRCGVEVTASVVRRERVGHIALCTPIAHVWYFKGANAPMSTLLDIAPQTLERVVYYAAYLVTSVDEDKKGKVVAKLEEIKKDELANLEGQYETKIAAVKKDFDSQRANVTKTVGKKEMRDITIAETDLKERESMKRISDAYLEKKSQTSAVFDKVIKTVKLLVVNDVLEEDDFLFLKDRELDDFITTGMGAEILFENLKKMDLKEMLAQCHRKLADAKGEARSKLLKKLRVVDSFLKNGTKPSWLMFTTLPVIPPDLRPVVQLPGGKFATSDLNDLYRRVINRNNRLKQLIELGAPEIILRNEKRMLQEAVDSLIDMQKSRGRSRAAPGSAAAKGVLKSLSDVLRGKQGRFRQNLLGKRVDYSARSTITVGPNLKLDQCGLPKDMALEIFKPFILHEVMLRGLAPNLKSAKNFVEEKPDVVYDILEEIVKDHPVIMNRAPTLHKLSMLGFYPVLIDDSAIRLHPTVCSGFNADFDGDAMQVFLPLSKLAVDQVKNQMLAKHNLLKPADGSPMSIPNKEMALGVYYITSMDEDLVDEKNPHIFSSEESAVSTYHMGKIKVREMIYVRVNGETIKTTVGRVLFNQVLPPELRFINEDVKAADIKALIARAIKMYNDHDKVSELIDNIKSIGFWGATIGGGLSVSIFDCLFAEGKDEIIRKADLEVETVKQNFNDGLLTAEEKRTYTNKVWMDTTEKIADITWDNLKENNPVKMIIKSGGARASREQLKQLSGMKGLVVDPMGKIIEIPTKTNYREGLSVFDYIVAARGGRKGLTDSALKTADAGYLTRRLHDVAHDMIIRTEESEMTKYLTITTAGERGDKFPLRILGRYAANDVKSGNTVLVKKKELITEEIVAEIVKAKVNSVDVYSPLFSTSPQGLCRLSYGADLSTGLPADIGIPAGVLAAQSIGEPGTQLTMRVRHFGGIVISDVTQGLPRVEELFETRTPKIVSPIAELNGKISILEDESKGVYVVTVTATDGNGQEEFRVPTSQKLKVKEGDLVVSGTALSEGYLDIDDILATRGFEAAQQYLVDEIQKVYESQGITIHDKHFEIIVRKMSDKMSIEDEGDSAFVRGEIVSRFRFEVENKRVLSFGGRPATGKINILGITRAAIFTDSWLSAASFEQTTSALSKAAIENKVDHLMGLKENVIIGRLIPVTKALIENYDQKLEKTYANNKSTPQA